MASVWTLLMTQRSVDDLGGPGQQLVTWLRNCRGVQTSTWTRNGEAAWPLAVAMVVRRPLSDRFGQVLVISSRIHLRLVVPTGPESDRGPF